MFNMRTFILSCASSGSAKPVLQAARSPARDPEVRPDPRTLCRDKLLHMFYIIKHIFMLDGGINK